MPRTALTVTSTSRSGIALPSEQNGDATNGMYFSGNNGLIILEVRNSNGSSTWTVGFAIATGSVDGVAIPDKTVSLAATVTRQIGPFPTKFYNQTYSTFSDAVLVNPQAGSGTDLKFRVYQLVG